MRADKRLATTVWTAGLLLAATPLAAQDVPAAGANTPATDAIGPRELQNFSLSGTVVRPADQPPVVRKAAPSAAKGRPAAEARIADESTDTPAPARQSATVEPVRTAPRVASSESRPAAERAPEPLRQTATGSSVTTALPPIDPASGHGSASAPAASAAAALAPQVDAGGTLAPPHRFPLLPWLLAAVVLGAGGAFLFWRGRSREAFAGGPQLDAFAAPEPAPAAPRPAPRTDPVPAPPKAAPPLSNGIVSTRLRPWIDVALHPVRCIVEEAQVTFDFELELYNSGSAPARAVLVEATVLNASPAQEQEIGAFFAKPVGEGERIAEIPPLKRLTLRSQVVAPRDSVQVFEVAGRQVFVPLIAFNALYRWGAKEGQSSVGYLLGRDTKGEKLAPFRLDLGPRVFRGVGARALPVAVRT